MHATALFVAEGRTLPKLILSVCRRTKLPWMTLAAFYVLVSRVQRFSSLRLLYHDQKGLEKVSWLQHDAYLYAWVRGYDKQGRWSDTLAAAALDDVRAAREAAKARAAEAKKTKAAQARAAKRRLMQQPDVQPAAKKPRTSPAQPRAQPARATGSSTSVSAPAAAIASAPAATAPAPPARAPVKCTTCGQTGHYWRRCGRQQPTPAPPPAPPSVPPQSHKRKEPCVDKDGRIVRS